MVISFISGEKDYSKLPGPMWKTYLPLLLNDGFAVANLTFWERLVHFDHSQAGLPRDKEVT